MAETIANPDIVEAFLDALIEKRDAEEFEALVGLGAPRRSGIVLLREIGDILDLRMCADYWKPNALQQFKAQQALVRLQAAHPDLWEEAVLTA